MINPAGVSLARAKRGTGPMPAWLFGGTKRGRNRDWDIRALGQRVAEALGLPFSGEVLALPQFRWRPCHSEPKQSILVVDDLCTSGRTMRHSIEAIRAAGAAAFGFAFSGC